jgi:hypothetical protein
MERTHAHMWTSLPGGTEGLGTGSVRPLFGAAGRALNSREDTEQLKNFERLLQRRPGLGEHLRRQNTRSKPRQAQA